MTWRVRCTHLAYAHSRGVCWPPPAPRAGSEYPRAASLSAGLPVPGVTIMRREEQSNSPLHLTRGASFTSRILPDGNGKIEVEMHLFSAIQADGESSRPEHTAGNL